MLLRDVIRKLGFIPEAEQLFALHWEESESLFPASGLYFLNPEYVEGNLQFCGVAEPVRRAVLEVAAQIRGNPELTHLIWHWHRMVFVHREYSYGEFGKWPIPVRILGERAGVFPLLVALSAARMGREHDKHRGIPEEITKDTWHDLVININRYARWHGGKLGGLSSVLAWFRNHAGAGLYRMGRLQFICRPFTGQVSVYRHRATGDVLALSDGGLRFDARGFRAPPDAQPDGVACWEAAFRADPQGWTGHALLPEGVACRAAIRLDRAQWGEALLKGDPVLEMHIPEGGGMTLERCGESMRQALEFWPRYLPDKPFKGFACQSWIMNPEFATFYSPTANFVLYQKEVYLYPHPWGNYGGVSFIFDAPTIDPKTAPRDTSIRRAMAEHLERGGVLRYGAMFLLKEDMPKFGTQCYRGAALFEALRKGGGAEELAARGIAWVTGWAGRAEG
ncbi:MAG: hypothetical protein A3K19_03950 [Lentisphaerae bacterium RIFOXYB12_FULL_65_16]|nr:MAG: hypothetical protein A3K18_02915 [Lentisphaerae bacterium RIFOXYA12_64_32]OGV89295.1 MAG: hypothetical protein A3K19_03950 [Lentisphaerae bacterium RIFOXYB12_FULL_65_16]